MIKSLVLLALLGGVIAYGSASHASEQTHRVESKVLVFVTSPNCVYCESIETAIKQGVAIGYTVQRVRSYPGYYGTPNLIKVVNGKQVGSLVGGPRSFSEIKQFLGN